MARVRRARSMPADAALSDIVLCLLMPTPAA
jgi:hypothetical protein